jgi:organic hydroperoxide reductase OsmC/OhrA
MVWLTVVQGSGRAVHAGRGHPGDRRTDALDDRRPRTRRPGVLGAAQDLSVTADQLARLVGTFRPAVEPWRTRADTVRDRGPCHRVGMRTDPPAVHRYATTLTWTGSTGVGYEDYGRGHEVRAAPAEQGLALSSDPAFRGDPARLNPEALLVAAASSCQLLSFLAVAARARIDVVDYADDATGEMPEPAGSGERMWVQRIVLSPRITVRGGASDDRLRRLVDLAHRECFIASSLRTEIVLRPTFLRAGD